MDSSSEVADIESLSISGNSVECSYCSQQSITTRNDMPVEDGVSRNSVVTDNWFTHRHGTLRRRHHVSMSRGVRVYSQLSTSSLLVTIMCEAAGSLKQCDLSEAQLSDQDVQQSNSTITKWNVSLVIAKSNQLTCIITVPTCCAPSSC